MSIGTEIARARQAAGLSHADLAERTRIRSGIIQAIERDDFDACGGDVYLRGHLRAIARVLSLDPAPWLDEVGGADAATALAQAEPERLNIWELRNRTRVGSERRVWLLLVLVAIVVIGALVYTARLNAASPELVPTDTPSMTASAAASETASATASPSATPMSSATSTPVQIAEDPGSGSVQFTLTCVAASWVRITNELGLIYEGTMQPGDTRDIASMTDVYVRVGNAAGLQLEYNGRFYPTLGNPGEVYSHIFRAA